MTLTNGTSEQRVSAPAGSGFARLTWGCCWLVKNENLSNLSIERSIVILFQTKETKMEQGKTELYSGIQLDEQQCSWSPSKTTKRKNLTEQTELESQVKQS